MTMAADERYDPSAEFVQIAYQAGRADAMLEAERARQSAADAAGDRMVEAAKSTLMRGLWGDQVGWQDSGGLFDEDGYDDEADEYEDSDEYEDGR
jgi:hypothetical protein